MRYTWWGLIVSLWFCCANKMMAQEEPEILHEILEQMAEERTDTELDELAETLQQLSSEPLNLNTAKREQLEELYFLSAEQVENFFYYRYRFGDLFSVYELATIDGFDEKTMRFLMPFVKVDATAEMQDFKVRELLKDGKMELSSLTKFTAEKKKGYAKISNEELSQNPNARYLGLPFYEKLKFTFNSRNRLQLGLVVENDAGEPFWAKQQKGFDFYSAYIQADNVWKFRRIVAGNYRASFGLGLVMNNNFSIGRSSQVTNVLPKATGISKSASSNEYNYLRGIAATIDLSKHFRMSIFSSYRSLTATPLTGEEGFSSVVTDGLHRTERELGRKGLLHESVVGGNVTYHHHLFHVGITGVGVWFSKKIEPKLNVYNQYYFRGNKQGALSVDYAMNLQKWKFFGETAFDVHSRSVATLNGVSFSPISRIKFIALHRYYSPKYQAWFSNSFSDGSKPSNETGTYVGIEVLPARNWRLSAHLDAFSYPWKKSGVSGPSTGIATLAQIEFSPHRDVSMWLRFNYKQREKNQTDDSQIFLTEYSKMSCRYVAKYAVAPFFFQSTLMWNMSTSIDKQKTHGWALAQDVEYRRESFPLSGIVHFVYFDAVNYDNRIYLYERDVLGVFATPMLYGKGSRLCVKLKANLHPVTLELKWAYTHYMDRATIGSDLEQINGAHRNDFSLLVRYKIK